MSEKPILFNTAMVQAILEGRKSVTRRIIKNKYSNTDIEWFENKHGKRLVYAQNDVPEPIKNQDGTTSHKLRFIEEIKKPYRVGDILYVRETWWKGDIIGSNDEIDESGVVLYAADGYIKDNLDYETIKWKPSIHMPKALSRIKLKITDIRAEKLQDMKEDDFFKEGIREFTKDGVVKKYDTEPHMHTWRDMPRSIDLAFKHLWDKTIKKENEDKYSFEANPWVWVIEFERIEKECK